MANEILTVKCRVSEQEKGREEVERNITCEYTSATANYLLETCSEARSSTLPLCSRRRWLVMSYKLPISFFQPPSSPARIIIVLFFSFCANFTAINYAGRERGAGRLWKTIRVPRWGTVRGYNCLKSAPIMKFRRESKPIISNTQLHMR